MNTEKVFAFKHLINFEFKSDSTPCKYVNKLCGQLTKASFSPSPSSVGVSPAVQKNLQTPCGQMTKFSRGESRAGVCFPAASPVVSPFLLPPLALAFSEGARSCTAPAPDLKA